MTEAVAAEKIDASTLDQSKIVDIDLGSPETKKKMRELSAAWATGDPFYVLRDGFVFVLCCRHRDALEVYQDPECFSTAVPRRPGFEMFDKFMGVRVLTQMEGEAHARVRRLMNNALAPRSVARIEQAMIARFDALIDRIEERGPGGRFDAMGDYGEHLVSEALLTVMLRLSPTQKEIFLDMHRVIPLITYTGSGHSYPQQCIDAFAAARVAINELIEERRANPGDDLISDLIAARDNDDRLNDEELFDQIFTLTAGALSGTTLGAGNVMYALYRHQDAIAEIQAQPELLPAAISECQRWHSGGYMTFPRFATRDTEVGGTKILKGMVVRVSPQAAHYDPVAFPDPLRFDIHRRPRDIAFGYGPHACLGHFLAKSILRNAVSRLLTRLPGARLENPDIALDYGGSVGELKIKSLPMLAS
jgi:cytochrome P450